MNPLHWLGGVVIAGACATYGAREWKAYKIEQVRESTVNNARSTILARLKDPKSAQWAMEKIATDKATVCGEFNSKNAIGGYVGFKRYIVGKPGYLIEDATYSTWSMENNPVPVPDYMVKASAMVSAGEMTDSLKDVFNWFWKNNCS